MYGRAACRVRGLAPVHRVWEAAAIALGRTPVFDKKFDRDDYVSSFDGIGYADEEHSFAGLKKHKDVYPSEPGQLQMLGYVHQMVRKGSALQCLSTDLMTIS